MHFKIQDKYCKTAVYRVGCAHLKICSAISIGLFNAQISKKFFFQITQNLSKLFERSFYWYENQFYNISAKNIQHVTWIFLM